MSSTTARRWGDNDRYFGPFTYACDAKWKHWAVILKSTDDEDRGASLRFSFGSRTIIIALPPIIRPWKRKVIARTWDEATVQRLGRNWYWDIHPREYGVSYSDGFLQVAYGRCTHDSTTEQRWGYFLPWTQWRQVSHVLFNADGSPTENIANAGWEAQAAVRDAVSTVAFEIEDYDGERIAVETYVEERIWRRGTGLFRWLGYIWPLKKRRSLDIRFNREVGPEKGSWKGGLCGHGIDMLPGETHGQAFRRYCQQEHRAKSGTYRIRLIEA